MRAVRKRPTVLLVVLLLALMVQGAPAVAAPVAPSPGTHVPFGSRFAYLSLGDSLAAGIQADENGANVETRDSYTDQLHRRLTRVLPGLRHIRLGCSGETTTTMLNGGICEYEHGSQLDEAVAVLQASRPLVLLVTIDIGANDMNRCLTPAGIDQACAARASATAGANLAEILQRLRAAARPFVLIVGMNYYNPYLAAWLYGPRGQELARATNQVLGQYNDTLEQVYSAAGVPVADVETAFDSTELERTEELPGVGVVPIAVARVCQWTWMCVPPPRRPNIHANTTGYGVIADAFEQALLETLLPGGVRRLAPGARV
jgi:lysophospholipase L1-like esterase